MYNTASTVTHSSRNRRRDRDSHTQTHTTHTETQKHTQKHTSKHLNKFGQTHTHTRNQTGEDRYSHRESETLTQSEIQGHTHTPSYTERVFREKGTGQYPYLTFNYTPTPRKKCNGSCKKKSLQEIQHLEHLFQTKSSI